MGIRSSIRLVTVLCLSGVAFARPVEAPADDAARGRAFDQRVAEVDPGDLEAVMSLANEAVELARFDEADVLYRVILAQDPAHDPAYYALWNLSRGRQLTTESESYAEARDLLPPDRYAAHETRHYVLLSDADRHWVEIQGKRLERAYDQFIRFANRLALRPLPLRHKLVAIAFADREDFARLSRTDHAPDPSLIAGYYNRPGDRLVYYHVESEANIAAARQQLEGMLEEIDGIWQASRRASSTGRRGEAGALRAEAERYMRHFEEQEERLDAIALERSIAVTIHEAIHQLMFHTEVQKPTVWHPMWLSEGLATAFETDAPRASFGPGHEFWPRRQAFYNLLDDDRLLPLRQLLVTDERVFARDPHAIGAVYLQGYALVTWLARQREPQLRAYLQKLNAQPPGPAPPERSLAIFEEIFGDIERLEDRWLTYERRGG